MAADETTKTQQPDDKPDSEPAEVTEHATVHDDKSHVETDETLSSTADKDGVEDLAKPSPSEQDGADDSNTSMPPARPSEPADHNARHSRWSWFGRHKIWSAVIGVAIILALLAAIPWTRYKLAGLFLKQTVTITVLDTQTRKPVASATVMAAGKTAETDSQGQAHLRIAVGDHSYHVDKAYYQSASGSLLSPILKPKSAVQVQLTATGRHVPVVVVNTITGQPVANAAIQAGSARTTTTSKGQATLVLPADKQSVRANITANGYNTKAVNIMVTEAAVADNTYQITPAGTVYFLSNRSGTIDVVKTDLDGGNRHTVVTGTGKEDTTNTVLLASRDWKYLALLSKRDGGANPKLFLITTATDTMTTIDEGDATFGLVGWSDHRFVYDVTRNNIPIYQSGHQVLKSFNADSPSISLLDQNQANGSAGSYQAQQFVNYFVVDKQVVYVTQWTAYIAPDAGKSMTIRTVSDSGAGKKDLKSFDQTLYWYYPHVVAGAKDIYFAFGRNGASDPSNPYEFYEYEDGAVKTSNYTIDQFNQGYPTYLQSPSGNMTFWSDARDGKNSLFVGDQDGKNGKEVLSQSEQNAYGWYTDGYLLSAKSGSELYVMSASGGKQLKVTDYYKPQANFRGYGGGYGGL